MDSAIDKLIHSAEVAHCTHTTEPMASHSHSGGPTAFRQNRSTAVTLSRPLRPTPNWASPGWPRVYQRHTDHRRGQNSLMGTGSIKLKTTGIQGYVRLPDQGKHAHNLPSWEAPARGMTIDSIRAVPYRQMWLHWKSLIWRHYDSIPSMTEEVCY